MKKQVFSRLYSALFIVCFVLTACDSFNNTVNNKPEELESRDLEKYKKIGEIVAAKEYSLENYDCANFATQFYQDCYKAGLPVRIRIGVSGGERFSNSGSHAWNSVKIDGQWVDWEPQFNDVHQGHTQTTSPSQTLAPATSEDISRFRLELVGRTVPGSIVGSAGQVSRVMNTRDSPYFPYFNGFCLNDDPVYAPFVNRLEERDSTSGFFNYSSSSLTIKLLYVYKLNDKYYGIQYSEELDPLEGR